MKRRIPAILMLVALTPGGSWPATAQSLPPLRCGTGIHAGEAKGIVWVPEGDLFCPLLADPKAERSFLSYLRGEFSGLAATETNANIGAVGL